MLSGNFSRTVIQIKSLIAVTILGELENVVDEYLVILLQFLRNFPLALYFPVQAIPRNQNIDYILKSLMKRAFIQVYTQCLI